MDGETAGSRRCKVGLGLVPPPCVRIRAHTPCSAVLLTCSLPSISKAPGKVYGGNNLKFSLYAGYSMTQALAFKM